MDFQYWLYIIIGIVYLLSQFRKKQDDQPNDVPGPERPEASGRQQPQRPPERQLTFEELLREITEGKAPQQPEPKRFQPEERYVSYEDQIAEEEESLEEVGYSTERDAQAFSAYEEAKRQVSLRSSLEETMKLQDTDMTYGRFKAFGPDAQRSLLKDYLVDLNDAEGLKKAVVMSEILQRKF
ncbi:MAG TPA: hypothetical protein VD884_10540 [Ohtaekwangia sp.]|nr:hypothetical protein [Ohtaekwangia sp.]